jgi:hypothetical protein
MYRINVPNAVTRAGRDVDVPGRYRGDAIEHRINHSPVEPARRRWQHVARNVLSAVACPTFKSVGS